MKTIALLAATSLVLVGCEQRDTQIGEPAGSAQEQIEQRAEAERERLEREQERVEQSADAEQRRVEAQAEAKQAELEAQQKAVEARAEAKQAELEAQQQAQQAQQQQAQQPSDQALQQQEPTFEEPAGAAATPGLTAQDQGTSESDRRITQQIRQSLTRQTPGETATPGATELSTAAKNVTIITTDGKVTLKGMVRTEAEKMQLEQRAKAVQGVQSVDNQLEVKPE